ncbi:class II aldolase/adducin family protein [Paenibacillus gansuensis]|uniref:Class II aldolase/adducin family protein n=1 Tax=Paenibacillus gansuensis TaxID=306542 RepID=A0ABW5P9Q4_9BACL
MMLDGNLARRQLQAAGKYMMDHGLAWGNSGNISVRTGDDRYVITGSGTFLGELADEDFVECTFAGRTFPEGRKASKEMPMHRAVYEMRPEIGAVLHASPFYATLFACAQEEITSLLFVETMYYLERVERVPYFHPGSEALGDAVREKAAKANVLLLENHGVLVYDTSVREAQMALHTLETACRMILTSRSAGVPLSRMAPQTASDFLQNAGYKQRREWRE